MNTIAEETFANVRTVKAFNNEETEIARFRAKNMNVLNLGKEKAIYDSIFIFVLQCIFFVSLGLVLWYSYKLYEEGKLSVG